jgi:acyl-CoA thioester hydrolase
VSRSPTSPQLPTDALALQPSLEANDDKWFEYIVRVHPHHTDYAGMVWHGTYISWLEEARIAYFRTLGVDFAELVQLGCDLPVVELSLRYHLPLRLGDTAIVKTRMNEIAGVRINWDYQIMPEGNLEPFLTGRVTLVAIDRDKGKIMRQLPSSVKEILEKAYE